MRLRTTYLLIAFLAQALMCRGQISAELDLFLHFETPPDPVFLISMENELSSILGPADLRLRWITGEHSVPDGKVPLRMTFSIRGICTASPIPTTVPPGRITLADTAKSGSRILPYTETNCDRLRNFLAPPYADAGADDDQRMGRAMARVLAHELYHFLLQTSAHSKKGIAKAVHTPAALLGRSLRFEGGELEKIRASYSVPLN